MLFEMLFRLHGNLKCCFEKFFRFEMLFRLHGNLHGDFTVATFQTIARLYCSSENDIF